MTRIAVVPLGDEKDRVLMATGLVRWHYNSVPVAGELGEADYVTPVWFFSFALIEETKMRNYIVQRVKTMFNLTESKAVELLCADRIGIRQDRIELQEEVW